MKWYCEKCRKLHSDDEMCPHIRQQLQKNSDLLVQAANFTTVAGEYELITTNALDAVVSQINKVLGTNLSYEGTTQAARDIRVFKRLNEESFVRSGVFSSPERARSYLNNATPKQISSMVGKINGSGQEVDWLWYEKSKLSALINRSELLNKNAVGVDGITYNRFTGQEITRVTVKTAQKRGNLNTNVQQIIDAVKKDRLNPNETVFGAKGTAEALAKKIEKEIAYAQSQGDSQLVEKLKAAKANLKIVEQNTTEQVKANNVRMIDKIRQGQAYTYVTPKQIGQKACEGAVIGAAVGLTVSSITSYIRYKNGELTQEEAFSEVSEDTIKSSIVGAATSTVTLFLPGGAIGFAAGVGIGIYVSSTCGNILDEVFGKGTYGAILDASGYTYGMVMNLSDAVLEVHTTAQKTAEHISKVAVAQQRIDTNLNDFEKELGEL